MKFSIKRLRILQKVAKHKLTPEEAYQKIYPEKIKKPHFIILRISLKKHKVLTFFLRIMTLLPLPLGIAKLFIKKEIKKKPQITSFLNALKYAKGANALVRADEAKIKMKLI